jgi:hypothetical protein
MGYGYGLCVWVMGMGMGLIHRFNIEREGLRHIIHIIHIIWCAYVLTCPLSGISPGPRAAWSARQSQRLSPFLWGVGDNRLKEGWRKEYEGMSGGYELENADGVYYSSA